MNKVAVYGSLRKGLYNHHILAGSTHLGDDSIKGFDMYSLGSFPYISPNSDTHGSIYIEVYEVTDQTMKNLDRLEGYPTFYDRKKVKTKYGNCWVYFMDRENTYSGNSIPVPKGDWKTFLQSKGKY